MATPSTPAGVQRHVYIKLADEHVPRAADIARTVGGRLLQVPGVKGVVAGVCADEGTGGAWDISLCIHFDDMAAVSAYVPHPAHQAILNDLINPVATFKKAWNFAPLQG